MTYETARGLKNAIAKNSKCRSCASKKADHLKLYARFKKSAEARNKEFALTENYVRGLLDGAQRRCYYTNSLLDYDEMSVDRLDSKLGYLPGNVVLCHKDINMMKYTFSDERFENHCIGVAFKSLINALPEEKLLSLLNEND